MTFMSHSNAAVSSRRRAVRASGPLYCEVGHRYVLVLLMGPRAEPDRKFSLFPWNALEILGGLSEEVRSIPRRCAENTRRIDRLITKRVGHPRRNANHGPGRRSDGLLPELKRYSALGNDEPFLDRVGVE